MRIPCHWVRKDAPPQPSSATALADSLHITPRLFSLLWTRGLRTPEDMDRFLSPGLRHLPLPSVIPGLSQAAEEVARCIGEGRTVAVWGDYDVDGVTSAALLDEFFSLRGVPRLIHLPDRHTEGYGLNVGGLERLKEQGAGCVVTVDCGITSLAEAERARELGLSLVVTDHHLPGERLPAAAAVANPRLADNPAAELAGVGVAFFLAAALNKLLPGTPVDVRRFLDLVALGTVADVAKLTGVNRVLVKNGLLLIKETDRPGVAALKRAAGLPPDAEASASLVGFTLGPRLNAAGRLAHARVAFDLLRAPDLDTAAPLAGELELLNQKRRQTEEDILELACAQAEELKSCFGLTLFDPAWHHGVIGIVAQRIVERFGRPTLVVTGHEGALKGSGRSFGGLHLLEALQENAQVFSGLGGHKQAAGFSLPADGLAALRQGFDASCRRAFGDELPKKTLLIDQTIELAELNGTFLAEIDLMKPFGPGNPEPVFAAGPVLARSPRMFGKGGEHLQMELKDPTRGGAVRAKAFRAGVDGPPAEGERLAVAFSPRLSTFNGITSIELKLTDWRAAGAGTQAIQFFEP